MQFAGDFHVDKTMMTNTGVHGDCVGANTLTLSGERG